MNVGPTIVICPGAWPLVEFFEPLRQALEAQGFPAVCKVSPGYPVNDSPATHTTNPDAQFLRESVLEPLVKDGKDVVLLMHSYGGVYGPSALEGLSKRERTLCGLNGGVVALMFVTAFVARKGMSAMSAMGINPQELPDWIDHDKVSGLVAFKKDHAKVMLFHDLPEEEAERLACSLPKQPYSCFSIPVHWDPYDDPNYQGCSKYIFTEADKILKLDLQQMFAEMAGITETVMLEKSSHSPHLERPVELAKVCIDLL